MKSNLKVESANTTVFAKTRWRLPPFCILVEEFNYTTLSIVFSVTSSGRGHAYRIFIFWTGKFEFRLTSNISAAEQATAKKIAVQKFTIEFYA